jgi:hypothetical protein
MKKFIFTFPRDGENWNKYVVIKAESGMEAREQMFNKYGREWAFQYTSKKSAGVKEYGLTELVE